MEMSRAKLVRGVHKTMPISRVVASLHEADCTANQPPMRNLRLSPGSILAARIPQLGLITKRAQCLISRVSAGWYQCHVILVGTCCGANSVSYDFSPTYL